MQIKTTTQTFLNYLHNDKPSLIQFTFFIILFYAVLLFSSCQPNKASEKESVPKIDSIAIKAALKYTQDSTYISFFLQEYISGISKEEPLPVKDENVFSKTMLPFLYDSLSYQLIWNDDNLRRKAINLILDSEKDGLVPQDFHLNRILELQIEQSDEYEDRAALDLLITDAIISYGNQLLNGKTDANSFEPTLTREEKVISDKMFAELRTYLFSGELDKIIQHLRPSTNYYYEMMAGLEKYKILADSGGWEKISLNVKKIEPEDELRTAIPAIRKRLMIEGDLILNADSISMDSLLNSPVYDSLLVNGVKNFQLRHGLNSDGIIGKGTVDMMNITAKEKVKLLKANLERARWIYHDLPEDYIFVNIPGYDLRFVRDSNLIWTTRVVAGKITSATPIFKDEMQYIVFNPTWTVPSSISNDEFLPKVQKDSTFFKRNNMQLFSGSGTKVNPDNIDFSEIKKGKFPYIVKQGPGGSNSLGKVKFIFPNPHYIYLHDTPSRGHFARERRAFSHGCIRVENPLKLSELVLEEQEVSRDSIDVVLKSKSPTRINLEEKLPVYITYSTAFADEGMVYFFEDVYDRDPPLFEALELN